MRANFGVRGGLRSYSVPAALLDARRRGTPSPMFIEFCRAGRWSRPGLILVPLFALLGPVSALPAAAQPEPLAWTDSRPQDLVIKLATFGPGDDIVNYFGHNAMIVQDTATGEARLYNFGMFHFGMDMLPNYMKGRLTFWVAQTPVRATFAHYMEMNRSVHVQELTLSPEQRKLVADELANNVLPQNRSYLYHHYFNNCSTRLRDLIDRAIGGQFKRALSAPARMSHRQHTRRYAQKDPITDFALVFWMNDQMEAPIKQWDELFLPEELEQQVAHAQYMDAHGARVPLVAASYSVFEAKRPPTPATPNRAWPWTLAIGLGFGLGAWLTAQWLLRSRSSLARRLLGAQHAVFGLLFGVPGLLGFLMWTLTEHTVTYRNENQLLANPLTLLLFPLGIGIALGSQRALRWTRAVFYALGAMSLALLALKWLPSFDQDTLLPLTLLLPANLGAALAHRALSQADATATLPVGARDGAASRA
jgi:hypothetical protein